ncbi:hypothetical protein D3C75_595020 [compost metagenome]
MIRDLSDGSLFEIGKITNQREKNWGEPSLSEKTHIDGIPNTDLIIKKEKRASPIKWS